MKDVKIILWGYPLHSHVYSYINHGLYRAFKHLGYNVVWTDNPSGVDFSNSFIITERWPAVRLPLYKTSTYIVNMLGNKPERYHEVDGGPYHYLGKVKRLIDFRMFCMYHWNDPWYNYTVDREKCELLSDNFYYQKDSDFEKIYCLWATDLLPHEINLEDMFIKRENFIHYMGSIGNGQTDLDIQDNKTPDYVSNIPQLRRFREACSENKIELRINNVWKNPLSFEESKKLTQKSYIAPDFRHQAMIDWGYIPCRIFKNISYGQLGMTNSKAVNEFFDGRIIYDSDPYKLFYKGIENMNNYDLIKEQMIFVRDHQTFINRVNGFIKLMEMEH